MENLIARTVLEDARRALDLWEKSGNDEQSARIYYASTLALLRAVGHVLQKVDSGASSAIAKRVEEKYLAMKTDRNSYRLFFNFIESERNAILKNYQFGAEKVDNEQLLVSSPTAVELHQIPFPVYFIDDGTFAGEDARDVAAEAIAFWDSYLADIERAVGIVA